MLTIKETSTATIEKTFDRIIIENDSQLIVNAIYDNIFCHE